MVNDVVGVSDTFMGTTPGVLLDQLPSKWTPKHMAKAMDIGGLASSQIIQSSSSAIDIQLAHKIRYDYNTSTS